MVKAARVNFQRQVHVSDWPFGRIPVVITAVSVILFLTLFPFTFHFSVGSVDQGRLLHPTREQLDLTVGATDFVRNCLLFLPLGLILTAALARESARFGNLVAAVLSCLFLTVLIEFLQTGLHSRTPAAADVAANTLGGWLGGILGLRFPGLTATVLRGLRAWLLRASRTRVVLLLLALHAAVAVGFVSRASKQASLANWDPTFHLMLGNEATGDRPWRGQLVRVEMRIADRLVLGFPGPGPDPMQLAGGQDISLRWMDAATAATAGPDGVRLDGASWLQSVRPAAALTKVLRRANRFRLDLVLSVTDTTQGGPARILSLSRDPWHRNLTLGQDGSSLVVRLRTPFSGLNGTHPALVVDHCLVPGRQHRFRVSYDGRRLLVRDGRHRILGRLELRYGAALCNGLFHFDYYDQVGYRPVYMGVLLLPLVGLVGLWVWGRRDRLRA